MRSRICIDSNAAELTCAGSVQHNFYKFKCAELYSTSCVNRRIIIRIYWKRSCGRKLKEREEQLCECYSLHSLCIMQCPLKMQIICIIGRIIMRCGSSCGSMRWAAMADSSAAADNTTNTTVKDPSQRSQTLFSKHSEEKPNQDASKPESTKLKRLSSSNELDKDFQNDATFDESCDTMLAEKVKEISHPRPKRLWKLRKCSPSQDLAASTQDEGVSVADTSSAQATNGPARMASGSVLLASQ